jgi:hypothetical protein
VKKADYPSFALKEGDVIEIVNFVGGGQEIRPCSKKKRLFKEPQRHRGTERRMVS